MNERRWWNGSWSRLTRRDVYVRNAADGRWQVELRRGGTDGRVRTRTFGSEREAVGWIESAVVGADGAEDGWREIREVADLPRATRTRRASPRKAGAAERRTSTAERKVGVAERRTGVAEVKTGAAGGRASTAERKVGAATRKAGANLRVVGAGRLEGQASERPEVSVRPEVRVDLREAGADERPDAGRDLREVG